MSKYKLGIDKYSFTEMYNSLTEEEPAGETVARALLKKFQFKDAFQIKDKNVAKWLVSKKLVSANKAQGTFSITDKGKNFLESVELNEAKMPEGSIVANKKTGVEFKVIENNGKGGIYVQPLNKNSGGTWFRETDMVLLKKKAEAAGDAKNYLSRDTIKQMIKSGKWEVDSGDAEGKSGSSLVMRSHTGKKRNVIIEAGPSSAQASKENGLKILMTAQKGIKKMSGKGSNKAVGRLIDETLIALDTQISEWKDVFLGEAEELDEDATANAKKSLDAIVGHLEKRKKSGADVLGATGRSMLKMGQGMQASYKQEGGFSPDQAKWIWKTSLALFK